MVLGDVDLHFIIQRGFVNWPGCLGSGPHLLLPPLDARVLACTDLGTPSTTKSQGRPVTSQTIERQRHPARGAWPISCSVS
jgi:hypothetical protein